MRISIALAVVCLLWGGCDQAEDSREVEYVADGTSSLIDVAFIAPAGIPAPDDTTVALGENHFVRGDTTFIERVKPPWKMRFQAEDGQQLYLRSINPAATGHVSSIIYVNGDYYASKGSGDTTKVAVIDARL